MSGAWRVPIGYPERARLSVWWCIAMAWAGVGDVQIVVDPPARRAVRVADPRPPLALQQGSAVAGPPLEPLIRGKTPAPVTSTITWGPDGLGVAVSGLADGAEASWLFAPDGGHAPWWIVGPAGARRCAPDPALSPPVPSAAVPCRPVPWSSGPDGWWLLWDALGVPTARARLLLVVRGERGGTWAPFGRGDLLPELGRRLTGVPLTPIPPGAAPEPSFSLLTPVYDRAVELSWTHPTGGIVPLTLQRGRRSWQQAVVLPRGTGSLSIEAGRSRAVTVVVLDEAFDAVSARSRRGPRRRVRPRPAAR